MDRDFRRLSLMGIDELFKSEEERFAEQKAKQAKQEEQRRQEELEKKREEEREAADTRERVQIVDADKVFPYARQPYSIDRATPDLVQLMDSIEKNGIKEPLIVRPREGDTFEIISGHRRDYCAKAVGLATRPVIVREMDDEEADILVVDYNITRENLLPSEKARAYKLRLDAMKRRAGRPSKNSSPMGTNLKGTRSDELLAEQVGESRMQIQRYIHLNLLIPELLEKVDSGALKFRAASDFVCELSEKEQTYLVVVMDSFEVTPSLDQARRLRELSGQEKLTEEVMEAIMREERLPTRKVIINDKKLSKYFPDRYTPQQMQDVILKLLEGWRRRHPEEFEE